MSIETFLVHDITILFPVWIMDRYGNQVKTFSGARPYSTKGWITQRSVSEVLGDREASDGQWVLFLSPEDEIDQFCRVVYDGETYEVAGRPKKANTPRSHHHTEIGLTLIEG